MVSLDVVKSCNASLLASQPLVALVTGGTSGIGKYTVLALATAHATQGKGLRVYIVGRNEDTANSIISECHKVCPSGDFRFVRADDLSLLKDVDRVCTEVSKWEEAATGSRQKPRVDLLVMCHGYLAFGRRQETKEGLDDRYSLLYYSRMRFIHQLLPLLLSSPLPAHVVSVFSPKRNDKFFPSDLSLRSPKNYNFMNMGSHVAYLTTFFFESLAQKYPGKLSLSHYFPGLVVHESFGKGVPRWLDVTFKVLGPVMKLWGVNPVESGERVLFGASERFPARGENGVEREGKVEVAVASDDVRGGGAYRVDWNGEIDPCPKSFEKLREDGMGERIWDHTMKAFEEIEAGRLFAD